MLLESGDHEMASRGSDIADCMPSGVGLNIQPFLNGAAQLSLTAENETQKIASLKVHVERPQCIKSFRIIIIKNVFPALKMSSDLNKIW